MEKENKDFQDLIMSKILLTELEKINPKRAKEIGKELNLKDFDIRAMIKQTDGIERRWAYRLDDSKILWTELVIHSSIEFEKKEDYDKHIERQKKANERIMEMENMNNYQWHKLRDEIGNWVGVYYITGTQGYPLMKIKIYEKDDSYIAYIFYSVDYQNGIGYGFTKLEALENAFKDAGCKDVGSYEREIDLLRGLVEGAVDIDCITGDL